MKKWVLTPEKFLKEDEVQALRTFLQEKAIVALARKQKKPSRDWAIIDIALSRGLRASEITNLKIKDVHIDKGENALFVAKRKGDKSRLVTISEKLKRHLKEYLAWKKRAGEPMGVEDYLFVSERSPKMTLSAVQKRFKHWRWLAG